jgi:hypothetical protein
VTVRRWAFLAALLLLLAQVVAAPAAQAALYPCLGAPADEPNGGLYPEPRIFLENQAWWQPTVSGTENHGHIHTAACFPRTTYADGSPVKVSGAMPVAIRTVLHDNPGLLRYARVHLTTDKSNHAGAFRDDIGENCVEGGPHWNQATLGCVWWSTGSINTAISEFDGYQEMRFSGNVLYANSGTSDTAFSSGGWQVYLANGKPVQHYRSDASGAPVPWTEGRGWYLGRQLHERPAGVADPLRGGRLVVVPGGTGAGRVRHRPYPRLRVGRSGLPSRVGRHGAVRRGGADHADGHPGHDDADQRATQAVPAYGRPV